MADEGLVAERRRELSGRLSALLEEFADIGDCDLPVVADWVLVVCFDSAADASGGATHILHDPHQWQHRTVGLLVAAQDTYRFSGED